MRNISQVAVLGQLVSDGAHSILDPVRLELTGIQIIFAGPLGGHLYSVLRVWHELKQTLRF